MKCCICSAVRNSEKYLDKVFLNMEKIGGLFEEYKIIMVYDKSKDKTLEKLKDYKEKNKNFNYVENRNELTKHRTWNIANARNICLSIIRENYIDYNYFIMMDTDDVCSENVKIDILKYYLENEEIKDKWDGLTFNKRAYYDLWALSFHPYIHSVFHFLPKGVDISKYLNMRTGEYYSVGLVSRGLEELLKKNKGNKLIKVLSAFNGFGIYKMEKYINCEYDGKPRLDMIPKPILDEYLSKVIYVNPGIYRYQDCEHRNFHYMGLLKNKANVYISPEILF